MDQQICCTNTPQAEVARQFSDRIRARREWDQLFFRLAKFHQKLFRRWKARADQELHTPPNTVDIEERLESAKREIYLLPGVSGIQIVRWNL